MIIKQNAQYELHATLTPYGHQQSLVLTQIHPQAQQPRHQQIVQVLLNTDELASFAAFLSCPGGAR